MASAAATKALEADVNCAILTTGLGFLNSFKHRILLSGGTGSSFSRLSAFRATPFGEVAKELWLFLPLYNYSEVQKLFQVTHLDESTTKS